jgi:hypothetical protein
MRGSAATSAVSGASGRDELGAPQTPSQTPAVAPAEPAVAPPALCTSPVSFDSLFQLVQADLLQQDVGARSSIRYISLTNQAPVRACAEQLAEQRGALAQALNLLSLNTRITAPAAINAERTIYRIDLRDYAWNRALQIQGESFGNVWEAIASANPFAVAFTGPEADAVAAGTGTKLPILFADQLLSAALATPLYYAIIGVNAGAPVGDFIRGDLGIDLAANLEGGGALRAGTTQSGEWHLTVIVERDAFGTGSGVLWQSLPLASADTLFPLQDLLGPPAIEQGEAMFSLPNGTFGFLSFDPEGTLQAPRTASCLTCHASGVLPVVDEAKATALGDARASGLTRDEVAQLQEIYVDPDVFARTVEQDSARYQSALQLTGVPMPDTNLVSQVVLRFDRELPLAAAAADLGLPAADLSANLNLLKPALGVLASGAMARKDFAAVFVDSLCILSTNLRNQPDPAACDAAAANQNGP